MAQLKDAAEDLTMWSVKECMLIVQELGDWDPENNRILMKKVPKKGGRRPQHKQSGRFCLKGVDYF